MKLSLALSVATPLLVLTACGTTSATTTSGDASSTSESPSQDAESQSVPLVKGAVTLAIKIRSKQCFGSAGCNITYRIAPTIGVVNELDGTYDVTYEVRGGEDGPIINTFSVEPDGSGQVPSEETAQTSSSSANLRAVVTSVEKQQ